MAKRGTITAWLRKRTSHLDYGYKWYGRVVHCNKNEEVLNHLRNKTKISHLKNKDFEEHFAGGCTHYFAGNSWGAETLVMIDIDCHDGVGSLKGALAYAQFLKDTLFPNLYFETSTNGNGAHGYFVLQKEGTKPETVSELFGQLQEYLRQTTGGFDIQTVEIKGRCPIVVWGHHRGEVTNYKAGTLAKIPRQAERFEELKNTTKFTVSQLRKMVLSPVPQADASKPDPVLSVADDVREIGPTSKSKTEEKVGGKCLDQFAVLMPPSNNNPTIKKKVNGSCSKRTVVGESKATTTNKSQIKERVVGSCSDRVISKSELEELKGQYLDVARTLLGTHPIKSGRVVATVEDLAILLMLLKYFTSHMNADGSLPWARVKGLWDALYEVRDVSRAFDPKRFAALRNYLSSLGLLDWADSTYHLPQWVEGDKVRGKACKWKANDLLMGMLQVEEGVVEETSLAGTNLQETISNLKRTPFSDTVIPILVIPMPIRMPTDEELRQRLGWAA